MWITRDWNTLEGVCWDPDVGNVTTLFTVHQKRAVAFLYLMEILKKEGRSFCPHSFVSDTAIKNSIINVFGEDMTQSAGKKELQEASSPAVYNQKMLLFWKRIDIDPLCKKKVDPYVKYWNA